MPGDDYPDLCRYAQGAFPVAWDFVLLRSNRIVESEHGNGRAKHVHGGCRFWGGPDEVNDAARQLALLGKLFTQVAQLGCGRKFTMPEQMNDFLKGSFSSQFVDIVAAIGEPTIKAIDIAQIRCIRDNPFKTT